MFSFAYEGINKEIQKIGHGNAKDYIRASRLAQGFDELRRAPPEQQEQILTRWRAFQDQRKVKGRGKGKGKNKAGEQGTENAGDR